MLIKWSFLIFIFTTMISTTSAAYQQGSYPLLSNSVYNSDTKNAYLVKQTIEGGKYIALQNSAEFNSLATTFFSAPYFSNYQADKLADKFFIGTMQQLVAQFACAEFRYRNQLAESNRCHGYIRDAKNKEKMPFVDGQFTATRIEAHKDSKEIGFGLTTYLAASKLVALDSLFGSVHQIGRFFGNAFDRRELVLSVRMHAYQLDNSGYRFAAPVNKHPLVYMVVLPRSLEIAKQANQQAAADFAIKNARLLILP